MPDRPDFPLPTITNPVGRRCIKLYVPDDAEHLAVLSGQLLALSQWFNWQPDAAKRGKDVAAVWRDIYYSIDWSGGDCDMQLVLEDCGLILKVGGVEVSAVDLTQCVDFYSLQLDGCNLTLFESGNVKNTIDMSTITECVTPPPPPPPPPISEGIPNCDLAWGMAEVVLGELAALYQYDVTNTPFPSKQNFIFQYREAFPNTLIARMPAGHAVAVANSWDVPLQFDLDILASAGAMHKYANIIYCALEARDAGNILLIPYIIGDYITELEFFGAHMEDMLFTMGESVTREQWELVELYAAANATTRDCTGFDCLPSEMACEGDITFNLLESDGGWVPVAAGGNGAVWTLGEGWHCNSGFCWIRKYFSPAVALASMEVHLDAAPVADGHSGIWYGYGAVGFGGGTYVGHTDNVVNVGLNASFNYLDVYISSAGVNFTAVCMTESE